MRVFGLNIPKAIQQRSTKELSREGKWRLQMLDWYSAHGRNARLTCRHFGISPDTFYCWKRWYNPQALTTLESRSHPLHRPRAPTWTPELAVAVRQLRTENPRWGKEKLTPLLLAQGWTVSVSMVGRFWVDLPEGFVVNIPRGNKVYSMSWSQHTRPLTSRISSGTIALPTLMKSE